MKEGENWESKGEKTRALYQYELSLRENPDYALAQKKMGLLLAESPFSTATAIYYLEKFYQGAKTDGEVNRELFRLYLATGYEKEALALLEDIRNQGKTEQAEFWESAFLCLSKLGKPKEALKKMEESPLAQDPYYSPWTQTCQKSL